MVWDVADVELSNLRWTPGNALVQASEKEIFLHTRPGAEPIRLDLPPRYDPSISVNKEILVHPTENVVAVLINPAPKVMRIDWFDLATGERTRTTTLPEEFYRYLRMSADGERLFLHRSPTEIRLVNPHR